MCIDAEKDVGGTIVKKVTNTTWNNTNHEVSSVEVKSDKKMKDKIQRTMMGKNPP